jgi:hypothetical protein
LLSLCSLYYVSCLREGYQIYIKPKTSDETTPPFLVCHWYTEEKIFAWEKATASNLNLDDEALNRCIQAGNKSFCNEAKVVLQGSPQMCLAAVWLQEWSSIKLMCHLWSRPAISSARKINSTHTVVTAPEDTEVLVQLSESPKMVRVIRGQWWLAMSAGCKVSTSSWEIVTRDKAAV